MGKRKWFAQLWPWAAYAVVALLVLWPLLGRGFVLTLDMVFTPKFPMPTNVTSGYMQSVVLHWLNYLLPGDEIEKGILLLILLLSGAGMHRLYEQITKNGEQATSKAMHATPPFFAGMLYAINPFTYDRFMAGQYDVLLGYALFPWFVRACLLFLRQPNWRGAAKLAAWAVITSIVSIHAVGFMTLVVVIFAGASIWRRRADKAWLGSFWKLGFASIGMFLAASSYWLAPLALGHGSTAAIINSFTTTDQSAFATLGGNAIGRIGNVLQLQGFWAENTGMFFSPQDSSLWAPIMLLLWILALVGAARWWRQGKRLLVASFGAVGLVSALLAAGIGTGWLAARVPLFAGYREPQKFDGLIALALVLFASSGVAATLAFVCKHGRRGSMAVASLVALVLPFAWTPIMLRAFDQQLGLAHYPAGWYTMNARLDADPGNFQTLFLPWHLYMYLSFEGRIIANPAPQFFDKPMIISNDPEFAGIPPTPNTRSSSISAILTHASKNNNLAAKLAPYHVKYIVLALDDDYTKYNYLNRQRDVRLVSQNASMKLYQVENFRGK